MSKERKLCVRVIDQVLDSDAHHPSEVIVLSAHLKSIFSFVHVAIPCRIRVRLLDDNHAHAIEILRSAFASSLFRGELERNLWLIWAKDWSPHRCLNPRGHSRRRGILNNASTSASTAGRRMARCSVQTPATAIGCRVRIRRPVPRVYVLLHATWSMPGDDMSQ